jgi:hypothetical protein
VILEIFTRLCAPALCAAALLCCSKKPPPSEATSAPSAAVSPASPSASQAAAPSALLGCRALEAEGAITAGGKQVRRLALVPSSAWLQLSPGSHLTVKHTASGREFVLHGPGLARVCPGGEEQVVLARGTLRTSLNTGVRPGAEALIATPAGVIRYGAADLEASVKATRTDVRIQGGDAFVEPVAGATLKGSGHVGEGHTTASLSTAKGAAPAAVATVCREAASVAAKAAEAVLSPGPATAGSLGERAAAQVRARQSARVICASALAWQGGNEDPAERQRLEASISESEQLWRTIPQQRTTPAGAQSAGK